MQRFKDFGSEASDEKTIDEEPIKFTLEGDDFECKPRVATGVILRFLRVGGKGGGFGGIIEDFFEEVLTAESFIRWKDLLEDPERLVSLNKLGEVAGWLIDEYTRRPTQAPSRSRNGRKKSGTTLTV